MMLAWAVLGIALGLVADLGLGRFAPSASQFVDPLMLPLAAYALRTSQRSAMVTGCASGLLQDYWMEPRLFGLNGLVKTLLGWALGAFGARFDLNNFAGRFAAGASIHVLDVMLQAALRRLFGDASAPLAPWPLLVRALCGGLLTAVVLAIVGRVGTPRGVTKTARRRT